MVFLRALPHTLVIAELNGHRANSPARVPLLLSIVLAHLVLLRLGRRPPGLNSLAVYGLHRPDLIMIEPFHNLILLFHLNPI